MDQNRATFLDRVTKLIRAKTHWNSRGVNRSNVWTPCLSRSKIEWVNKVTQSGPATHSASVKPGKRTTSRFRNRTRDRKGSLSQKPCDKSRKMFEVRQKGRQLLALSHSLGPRYPPKKKRWTTMEKKCCQKSIFLHQWRIMRRKQGPINKIHDVKNARWASERASERRNCFFAFSDRKKAFGAQCWTAYLSYMRARMLRRLSDWDQL